MAGQTGQNGPALSLAARSRSGVVADLLDRPGSFAFAQAVEIASRVVRSQGLPAGRELCRFRVNPSLSFPPGDIEELRFAVLEDGSARVELTLNLMGLHGAASPLPAYFTEHVARHQGEGDALQDFLDAVNHRLVSLLHASWRKYRYYVQYRRQAVDPLSARFLSLIGARSGETRGAREIQWPRLLAYMGLIALNGEAAGSLESILRHYFGRQEIRIVPCIRRWVAIPGDQQTRLGTANRVLGEDFILGDEVEDQTGKFRISISQLGWEDFLSFLPCREKFHELRDVVKFVMKSRLSFDVELRLKPGEVREWRLGGDDGPLLGWNTWSGEGGDGVLVLDTNHEEV